MNLFMGMSRRSKDTPQTPFLTLVSQRNYSRHVSKAAQQNHHQPVDDWTQFCNQSTAQRELLACLTQHQLVITQFCTTNARLQPQPHPVAVKRGLLAHLVCPEVKQLDITIVIPSQHAALIIIEGVAKSYAPAVPAGRKQHT